MPTEYSRSIFQLASLFSALFVEFNAHSVLFFICMWGEVSFFDLFYFIFFIFGRMRIFFPLSTQRERLWQADCPWILKWYVLF